MKSEVLNIYSELQKNQLLYKMMKAAWEVKDNAEAIKEATDYLNSRCYPAFYLVLNHATFKQIKKRHNINYSDGFYIGLLYAVPLVLS